MIDLLPGGSTVTPPAEVARRLHGGAREAGDVQAQLDVLFHILTGVDPTGETTS